MADSLVREGRASRERTNRTVQLMIGRVPHTLVEGYEDLIPVMLCDAKDRHVLAAGVRATVGTIVTFNGKDFPPESPAPYQIAIHTPDEFLLDLWDLSCDTMIGILREQAATLEEPPMTARQSINGMSHLTPKFESTVLGSGMLDDEDAIRASPIRERRENYRCPTLPN